MCNTSLFTKGARHEGRASGYDEARYVSTEALHAKEELKDRQFEGKLQTNDGFQRFLTQPVQTESSSSNGQTSKLGTSDKI